MQSQGRGAKMPHTEQTKSASNELPGALLPGTMIDRYEVLGLLGVGGMASVYRARHRQLDSVVALKVLVVDRPSIRRRVEREGRVAASIHHPNLVAVTDYVTTRGGTPVLVLEYVGGPSLDRLLAARRLALPEVDSLVRSILRGIAHAHAHGVVHRDLKPANVLIAPTRDALVPKITDFGIVKLLAPGKDPTRTMTGQLMGTPGYMAPEQFSDASQVDVRADVWSLGVLMYELCTGQLPFGGDNPQEVFSRLLDGTYPGPRTLMPRLPERMLRAIELALQHDRARRAPDVETLLAIWCDGVPDAQIGESFGVDAIWHPDTIAVARSLAPNGHVTSSPASEAPDTTLKENRSSERPTVIAQPHPTEPSVLQQIGVTGVVLALVLTAAVASAFVAFVALSLGSWTG